MKDSRTINRPRRLAWKPAALLLCLLWSGGGRAGLPVADRSEPITPVPAARPADDPRIGLGRRLFHDPRLSRDSRLSCASCHDLYSNGAGNAPRATTLDGQPDVVNTPTVFNVALNYRLGWSGHIDSLESQVDEFLSNPGHGDSNWPDVLDRLSRDPGYLAAFRSAYPADGLTTDNVRDALATFQRSLLTPDSRFDRYLQGHATLNEREQRGYELFKSYGCIACHQGSNVGGNLLQRVGVFGDYFELRGTPLTAADLGLYRLSGDTGDLFRFRVPGLRNVAVTAPYFHDGSIASLEEAVRVMARIQLGINLPEQDEKDIAAFLRTLTGRYQGRPLTSDAGPHAR